LAFVFLLFSFDPLTLCTVLHLLGLNHEKLTCRYAGRDFRLTDVYGNVVRDVIA